MTGVTPPTHLVMVVNRDTCELKLISAHDEAEAKAAFENLAGVLAATPNDVHCVTIPDHCGFVIGEIVSRQGGASARRAVDLREVQIGAGGSPEMVGNGKGGIRRNTAGEYVQQLADGSEIISSSDFGDE